MKEEFNNWWNSDDLLKDNPYRIYTPAYWAWEGWCAAARVEREECAKVCDEFESDTDPDAGAVLAAAIRARGQA